MRLPDYLNGIELFEVDIFEEDMKCDDQCINCSGMAIVTYNKKYRGWMAYCYDCDVQWRCS